MSQGKKREEKPLTIKINEADWNKIRAYCRAASPLEIMGLAESGNRAGRRHQRLESVHLEANGNGINVRV